MALFKRALFKILSALSIEVLTVHPSRILNRRLEGCCLMLRRVTRRRRGLSQLGQGQLLSKIDPSSVPLTSAPNQPFSPPCAYIDNPEQQFGHCTFNEIDRVNQGSSNPSLPSAAMAKVQQRIQQVLDPTKIATLSIVRLPPIPQHTVIQGKPRELGSNAHLEFQKQEGARLRKALERLTHGRNIFVYNNIRTNQVVYSLTRYLEVSLHFRGEKHLRRIKLILVRPIRKIMH